MQGSRCAVAVGAAGCAQGGGNDWNFRQGAVTWHQPFEKGDGVLRHWLGVASRLETL